MTASSSLQLLDRPAVSPDVDTLVDMGIPRPKRDGPELALVAGHEDLDMPQGQRVRLCADLVSQGYIPDIGQIDDVRDYFGHMGPLAKDVLGREVHDLLSAVADPENWLADPVDMHRMQEILDDAAEILRRRDAADGSDARPDSKLRLAGRLSEERTLAAARDLLENRFGTSVFTPSNMNNAVALMNDAWGAKVEELGHHGYRAGASPTTAVGIARVPERPTAEQAPGDMHNLLWLMARDAKPGEVKKMLYPAKTIGGQGGAWARQPKRQISEADVAELGLLSRRLGIVNGYKRTIAKGGGVPTITTLMDELIGRRESIDAYGDLDVALVQGVLAQLQEQHQRVAETRAQAASKKDRLAALRHHRDALQRWGKRKRGDADQYYPGYETGQSPRRSAVARWIGTSAVWVATQFKDGEVGEGWATPPIRARAVEATM